MAAPDQPDNTGHAGPPDDARSVARQGEPLPAASAPAQPSKPAVDRRWRAARFTAKVFAFGMAALLALAITLGSAGWWWSGTAQSLGDMLALVARYMPAGQTIETRDVQGSVRGGGHIGWLRWQSPTLTVELSDVRVGWTLKPFFEQRLQLGELRAERVVVSPRGPANDKPIEPLTNVALPIDVDVPFDVRELQWTGKPETLARALLGHYRYAGGRHHLQLDGVDIADGHYAGLVDLQGAAPMDISATLQGRIKAPVPAGAAPLSVVADATLKGTLAGTGARLNIAGRVAPDNVAQARPEAMRGSVVADIAPWASQPVVRALAEFEQIDAARFWPSAPRTQLSGKLAAGPDATPGAGGATAWHAHIDARNAAPGPWDQQKLPVTRIDATARFDGRRWVFPKSEMDVAGGRIQVEGDWSPAPAPWRVDAIVQDVKPTLLYTGLDGTPVSGTVKADQQAALSFDVALRADARRVVPAGRGDLLRGFRIDQVIAQGQWREQAVDLKTLKIESGQARISGNGRVRIDARSADVKMDLIAPGANAKLEGRIAPAQGSGQASVAIQDAAILQRWAATLPGMASFFAGMAASGAAQLDARWQGGWETFQQQLAAPSKPLAGLEVQAALKALNFELQMPAQASVSNPDSPTPAAPVSPVAPTRLQLRNVRADLAGSPVNATLAVDGLAILGTQQIALNTRASGGIAGVDEWRVALASLRLQVSNPQDKTTAPWTVELASPLSTTLRRTVGQGPDIAATTWRLDASAGTASVSGPAPGTVRLEWQPVALSQTATPGQRTPARYQVRTQGKLVGLPMAWAQALGANVDDFQQRADITGDLVFDGDWDIDAAQSLRATARLARRSGDLRVRAGEAAQIRRIRTEGTGTKSETKLDGAQRSEPPATPAGLRRAELVVTAQGEAVRARFEWDSDRAGVANADIRTTLTHGDDGWSWAENAPLTGAVKARMPDIGVWSLLAPPAWRIDGTLSADATLSGNRADPQWNGTLGADKLGVKAAVEGIELRDGKLRTTLRGNRLQIDEFTMSGGSASRARIAGPGGNLSTVSTEAARDGGDLAASGEISWGAASGSDSGIQMAVSVRLRALRVLVRSDRQVTASGNLQATLDKGQLVVRGVVKTDRGVIILADETAPTLGSDVVVRSAAIEREEAAAVARAAASANATATRAATSNPRKTPDVAITVDMGDDFAVQGHGLTTRLAGQVEMRSNAESAGQPRVTGEIRTVNGRYRAYGQQLDVDSGIARFYGPYDNPSLDILAIRPNIEQRAGVRITGPALAPRVVLYSQPQLTDAEALSWMMLGRSTAGGGAEALVMQQAALALLGGLGPKGGGSGNFASRFGLDEIGFKGPDTGADFRTSAITVGKRLSNQVYVTYEHSLAGALGTLYIFYDLTRRLALRGQAGTRGAVDVIYTVTFD